MKIVDVCEFYADQGGGVKTYVRQKLRAGAAAGHEVVVIAPGRAAGTEEAFGGRIVWVAGPPMPLDPRYTVLWNEDAVHRALDRERPDVLEGSSPWSGGWFAARWPGRAVRSFVFHQDPVAVYPETLLDRWVRRDAINAAFSPLWAYLRLLSRRYDTTVTGGRWLAEKLARRGLQRPHAIPFGVDRDRFSPARRDPTTKHAWLERCGVAANGALVVCVSRMHPEKRLGVVIDAFARAARERPMGLVLFGDGPTRPLVERHAARTPGVVLAGYSTDRELLPATLASADAMLHGSAAETYGLVVAEAICSGLPVVVPAGGGAADLAGPEYAETYEPGDVAGGAAALLRLLSREPASLRAGCAAAAAARVGTMDAHFRALFAYYGSI